MIGFMRSRVFFAISSWHLGAALRYDEHFPKSLYTQLGSLVGILSKRIPELDGLRGIAISLVLFGHYFVNPWRTIPGSYGAYLQAALRLTGIRVDLFFVLSGFLSAAFCLIRDRREITFERFMHVASFVSSRFTVQSCALFCWSPSSCPPVRLVTERLRSNMVILCLHSELSDGCHFGANFLGITWSARFNARTHRRFTIWCSHRHDLPNSSIVGFHASPFPLTLDCVRFLAAWHDSYRSKASVATRGLCS